MTFRKCATDYFSFLIAPSLRHVLKRHASDKQGNADTHCDEPTVRLCIHGLHQRQRYEPTKIAMHAKIITTKPSAAPLMCVSKCHPTPHRYAIRFQPVATTGTTGPRSNALIKKWGHFGSLLWFSVLGNKTGTCTLALSRRWPAMPIA